MQTSGNSDSIDDVTNEVNKILTDAGGTTDDDRAEIKKALEGKWSSGKFAALSATTGACYFRVAGVLECESGLTQSQCVGGKSGKFVAGQSCGSLIVWEVLEQEHLI